MTLCNKKIHFFLYHLIPVNVTHWTLHSPGPSRDDEKKVNKYVADFLQSMMLVLTDCHVIDLDLKMPKLVFNLLATLTTLEMY